MRKISALILLFFFPLIVFGGDIEYIEAKKLADKTESNLKSNELQLLTKAQGIVASNAFPYCVNAAQSAPTNFTVVLKLDTKGKTIKSWRKGDSRFAKCFQIQINKSLNYIPLQQPFYTAFEYKNAP